MKSTYLPVIQTEHRQMGCACDMCAAGSTQVCWMPLGNVLTAATAGLAALPALNVQNLNMSARTAHVIEKLHSGTILPKVPPEAGIPA
eukprot:351462-Chlamydomonas_euryale.AAC.9